MFCVIVLHFHVYIFHFFFNLIMTNIPKTRQYKQIMLLKLTTWSFNLS